MAMAVEKLHLKVTTPESVMYDKDVDMVIMRCVTGDMGILPKHEACSAILDYGVLRIRNNDEEQRMAVFGGIARVQDNSVTILANEAQWPEDIDLELAETERERTSMRLLENTEDLEIQKEQVALRRSLVQIEVSSYPLLGNK